MNMKRSIKIILMAATVSIFIAAGMAAADGIQVQAHVPFDFIATGQTFSAGNYTFSVDDPIEPSVLTVQHEGGGKAEVTLTESDDKVSPVNESKVVFDTFHGKYYLAEVWMEGMDEGRLVPKSEIRHEEARVRSAISIRGNK